MINNSAAASRLHWHKSSYSGTAGNCLEIAVLDHNGRVIRDSKDPTIPMLTFTATEWSVFIAGVRCGEFD